MAMREVMPLRLSRMGRKPARLITAPMRVSLAMLAIQKSGVAVMVAWPMRLGRPSHLTTSFITGRSMALSAR